MGEPVPRFSPLTADDPRTVAGYQIRARLGAGGMGRVYLSFTPGGRPIAIKVVRPEFADDEEFRRRFRQEVEAAQRVQGLYTAPVVDSGPDAELPWLATAYVPGPSLQEAIGEHGPLPLNTIYRLLAGVAEALVSIHGAGLIHRDLKAANVLLADDGPRVIDFGIARAAEATTATRTGVRIGTPAYMAPEQVRGQPATAATDVWALAQLVAFAATGNTAFSDGNTDALFYRIVNEPPNLDGCQEPLRGLLERCLTKDQAARPGLTEIIEFARAQTAGETMNLAASWLPTTIATQLAAYDTAAVPAAPLPRTAPMPPVSTQPGSPAAHQQPVATAMATPPPSGPGVRGPIGPMTPPPYVGPPRPRRQSSAAVPLIVLGVCAAVVALFFVGGIAVLGLSGGSNAGGLNGPSASPTSLGYAQEYQGVQFTLPGADCTSASLYNAVSFNAQGPKVEINSYSGDLVYTCDQNSPLLKAESSSAQIALVDKPPANGPDCVKAVNLHPLDGNVPFGNMHEGMQLCLVNTGNKQIAYLKLVTKASSAALTWSATGWNLPSSSN